MFKRSLRYTGYLAVPLGLVAGLLLYSPDRSIPVPPGAVAPLALAEGDADRDGIPDALEDELAERYAPIVILDKDDWNRPASIEWLLGRPEFREGARAVVTESIVPVLPPTGASFRHETRKGSDDPEDWVTYVHVYPRVDGGISIQYWFFFPYNDGPLFFNHESDWEHLTVRLDENLEPIGMDLSRHADNNPGPFFAWDAIRREGDRPVVLSANGTHATYASLSDLAWFEKAGDCADLEDCEHPVWRTWEGGGLENLGERGHPRRTLAATAVADDGPLLSVAHALFFPGTWGQRGLMPGTSAPPGPMHQRGFCHGAFEPCRGPHLPRRGPPADPPQDSPSRAESTVAETELAL